MKGFPLKVKSFRNTATYQKLRGGVPSTPPLPPCTTVGVWIYVYVRGLSKVPSLGCMDTFWNYTFWISLKSDPCVFPLLSVVLFLFFFKLARVFSRGPHPAKAPRRTREKTSGTRDKRCLVKQMFFRMADMSSVELYWFCCFSFFGGRSSFISSLQIMQWKFSDLFASY